MRNKQTLLKLFPAGLCALFATSLPLNLSKPHEIGLVAASHFKAVQPLTAPKVQLASQLSPVAVPAPPVAAYSGTGDPNLDYIIQHESSGNPYAVNEIGACGLGQALPCSKMGCALSDVNCQVAWVRSYALARYGSTAAAANYWAAHRNW